MENVKLDGDDSVQIEETKDSKDNYLHINIARVYILLKCVCCLFSIRNLY